MNRKLLPINLRKGVEVISGQIQWQDLKAMYIEQITVAWHGGSCECPEKQ